ncbi:SusC/RagA family TonB-linked outer membrane protein [Flammeovirga sp. OC4]|uniref:SusC/RagA family TonB-linked outer membrane protein n=1 Tax=Flammeovirga sp. OC4 TaxID=1382345 RepID=UPI0005C43FB3|nr:SusC/RagA family TonB-linked outer membrane protein [Flammeovirga sp. OC4]
MKKTLLLVSLMLSVVFAALAQERTVSGVIKDPTGETLPGVAVIVKSTTQGTVTGIDGSYRLMVSGENPILVFKLVGYKTQEVAVGAQSTISISLEEDVEQLDEVVVTALNVTREKASLGYATQTVKGEDVATVKEANFVNSLSGKVAGVQIRTNNNFGGSTNVVIRGTTSITGNNQPLFVVDGVPIDNSTGNTSTQQGGGRGYDYGNAASDINPEDIESMNVLKGAAATALYGSRASNGAIVITTKKGSKRKGIGVNISSGVTVGKILKSTFTEYQNQYGAGYGPYYGSTGYFLDDDVNGDGNLDFVVPTTEDGSYGAKFDPSLNVYHWDSFVKASENYGKAYAWTAGATTPVDFFETSYTFNNSISLEGGNESSTFRLGYTNYQSTGILPNSEMKKDIFSLTGTTKLHEKLEASASVNVNMNSTTGRNSTGYSDNLMSQFRQWWQTNVDVKSLENLYHSTNRNITWNAADYYDPETPIYWDNPYWTRFQNYQTDSRNRVYGNASLNYKPNQWLSVLGRATMDQYTELREERRAVGSIATPFGVANNDEKSGYSRLERNVSEFNYDLMLTANKYFNDDFSLFALLGSNIRVQNFESVNSSTNGGLAVPGIYALSNSVLPLLNPIENKTEKQVYGIFTNVSVGYKNMLYLDLTARNDISSALPTSNNSYLYGSVAGSYVFTEMLKTDWLNFGKFRASYGKVGNDTDPNRTSDFYYRNDNFGSSIIYTLPTRKNNQELKPEETYSFETGIELSALDNRIGLDVAYYKMNSFNQIFNVSTSRATGYTSKFINGGEIENRGWEIALKGTPIVKGGFKWDVAVNWSRNRNEVISLVDDVDNLVIRSFQGGISANATVGQPYGILRGTGYTYHENGEKIVDANGYYKATADQVIGDPNPDWNGGLTNTFSYKGVRLSFLLDMQKGGDVYSLDMHYGQGTGITANTAGLNDLGNPVRNSLEDGGGVLNPGVQEDGTPNTVRARADYYGGAFYWGNGDRNPGEMTVYDATYVKLRELSVSYTLPKKLVSSWAQNVTVSFVGRNLAILYKNTPYFDPESGLSAGNAQGYVSGAYPTTATYGFKLDLSF